MSCPSGPMSRSTLSAPPTVVHLCRVGWPHRGGMESVVGNLAAVLAERGLTVRVVTLDTVPGTATSLRAGVYRGVVYRRVRAVGPHRYPFATGLGRALVGADLVHVHGIDGLLHQSLALRARLGFRLGVTPHGAFLHSRRQWMVKQLWMRSGVARALRSADAVWHNSEACRRAMRATGVCGGVIPDGVDIQPFLSLPRAPEPGRWFVWGRVDRHKGLDRLIDRLAAVAHLDERPFRLRIGGAEVVPGLVRSLLERARSLGIGHRISFLGPLSDGELHQELSRCEIALFPSRFESFGLSLVEAMAAGVPVVVHNLDAFREIVTHEVEGLVTDFGRSDAARLLRGRRGTLEAYGAAGRRRAMDFGWQRTVTAWESAYADVLQRTW
jgi:alpha-1,3-mannosyltransferase